jgi:glutamate/tyrosine decarboxylase-like PLP-dependent enzyme
MDPLLATDLDCLPAILDNARAKALSFLASLEMRPAAAPAEPFVSAAIPEFGVGAIAALDELWRRFEPQFSGSAGPRYLGFVTGGATPAAMASDMLVSVLDQNVQRNSGTVAPFIEREALDWLRAMFGLSGAFTGSFVTGATMSNVVGLAIGRQWVGRRFGIDLARQGLTALPPIRVLSASPHASTLKAMAMLGLGRDAWVPVATLSGRESIDLDDLDRALAACVGQPVIVVGNAGTVNTVDFDDLRGISQRRARHPFWFHVDAAFGAFAACSPRFAELVDGIDDADSVAVDAHKWLNVPYDAAMQYTRHIQLQIEVFQNASPYLGFPDAAPENFLHLTPENSRRFRALTVWTAIMAYGREGHREIIERCCDGAAALGARLANHPDFELLAPVRMNVVCFGLRAGIDRQRFLHHVSSDGRTFVTPTVLHGKPAVRAAFSNWRTTAADVDLIYRALAEAAMSAGSTSD